MMMLQQLWGGEFGRLASRLLYTTFLCGKVMTGVRGARQADYLETRNF